MTVAQPTVAFTERFLLGSRRTRLNHNFLRVRHGETKATNIWVKQS